MLVAEVVDPPPELDPPEPPVEPPVPVEFAEVGGVEDVALESADEPELPWPQAARDTIRRRVGIALIVLIALGIRIMVARSGNSIWTPTRAPIAGRKRQSVSGMTSARHRRLAAGSPAI